MGIPKKELNFLKRKIKKGHEYDEVDIRHVIQVRLKAKDSRAKYYEVYLSQVDAVARIDELRLLFPQFDYRLKMILADFPETPPNNGKLLDVIMNNKYVGKVKGINRRVVLT